MKRLLHLLTKSILSLETIPTSYGLWLTSFASLIFARLMVESWLGVFETHSQQFLLYEFTHTFFFFLFSFLILWPIVAFFGKTSLSSASTILLFGFLIILTPPLIDTWIANGAHLWSFYKFDTPLGLLHRYFTLFGDRPDIGITYGVRVEVALTTLFIAIYTFVKSKNILRSLFASIAVYSILFILGTFPSWIAFMILGWLQPLSTINDVVIAQLFISPPTLFSQATFEIISGLNIKMSLLFAPLSLLTITFYLWRYFPQKFFALINNARIPQIIYHGGLLFVGMGLAIVLTNTSFIINLFNSIALVNLLIAIGCAWLASVIANDLFDQKIDAITNTTRPLPQKIFSHEDYKALGNTFFAASLLFAAMVHIKIFFLMLIYQALAWMYSAWPLRLKRFPIIATFFASLASLLIILSGFILIAPNGNISQLPTTFIFFFLFVFMTSLPLKDFKDIAGDKADHVYTIPVLLGEQKAKLLIGSGIFMSYLLSILIFHELKLFLPALLCGSLSFWILMIAQAHKKTFVTYHKMPAWLIGITALYTCILIKILFF